MFESSAITGNALVGLLSYLLTLLWRTICLHQRAFPLIAEFGQSLSS